ncbi:MAG: hypothetical protein HDKAJFGB_04216 [Anaerolineae bacterium]|nr:hypothetical protein [Anaerolineae bacterium]
MTVENFALSFFEGVRHILIARAISAIIANMTRYVAFLRAINVGGHTVKMETLRALFQALKFQNVETFIASGNVIFETDAQRAAALERAIAQHLEQNLGYAVATFLRTDVEMRALVAYQAFPKKELDAAGAFNVAFLAQPLNAEQTQNLMALQNKQDRFHVHAREVYWLCQTKQSESKFSNAVLEKTIRAPATLRGFKTIQKLTAQHLAQKNESL